MGLFCMFAIAFKLAFRIANSFPGILTLQCKFGINILADLSFDKMSVWVEDTAKLTPTSVHHRIYYYNYFCLTKIGKVAPNNQVHKLDGSAARVLDYCKPDRPLVLLLAANS